ncbi:MAG: HEPN domain-containing protein [Desulfobaccales bacterium]|nr:HEPN domain-containing protein [Desulfobaccales bacterium]
MNPNDCPLYAGIAGVTINVDEFDFGEGVGLRKTYAHVMAPYLAAFAPAEPGKPHPAPWKAVSGGVSFDIQAEIYLPLNFKLTNWFDRLNTVWWFAALMRLKASNFATIPVIASKPFAQIPSSEDEPHFWPIEMKPSRLVPVENPSRTVNESDLLWIRKHWVSGGRLMNKSDDFNLAFQAIDDCIWSHSPSLALVSLWGALERLFSPSHDELSFRVSATIASYLKPAGEERLACYRRVKKLYKARSKAAHGSPIKEVKSLPETYSLLKRALVKMIEENHVPSREELESFLFGTG